VQRKRQHLPTDRRDFSVLTNRPEVRQQFLRVRQRNFIRLFQPAKGPQIVHARRLQSQHHLRQIQSSDFRQFMRRPLIVLRPRPEPDAMARRRTAGAPRALVRIRLRNFFDQQRVEAPVRVVTRDPRQPGINHQSHAINRDARLRHIRGHHHLRPLVPRHRRILILRRQFAVQRQHEVTLRR
jgi:hypothetical protein